MARANTRQNNDNLQDGQRNGSGDVVRDKPCQTKAALVKTGSYSLPETDKVRDGGEPAKEGSDAVKEGCGNEPANEGSDAVWDFHGSLLFWGGRTLRTHSALYGIMP